MGRAPQMGAGAAHGRTVLLGLARRSADGPSAGPGMRRLVIYFGELLFPFRAPRGSGLVADQEGVCVGGCVILTYLAALFSVLRHT